MNRLLTLKLRMYAGELREMKKEEVSSKKCAERKEEMLSEFYRMLITFLGRPPERFDFEYRNDDNIYYREENISPRDFRDKFVKINTDEFVSVINAPTFDKPFNQAYTVKYLGNVAGGKEVLYLNVDKSELKRLTLAQLDDGEPVWFGCDMDPGVDSKSGTMSSDLYLAAEALGTSLTMEKGARLLYGESALNHAMMFTGVNTVDGAPDRWKVENSWGDKSGKDGFFVMDDKWFDENTYQVVINRKYLNREQIKSLSAKPVVLPPWDPMGSLALMK